jgi:hypothetical protein
MDSPIRIAREDILAAVTAPGDVVRAIRNDDTSTTWHLFDVSHGPCLFHEVGN